MPQAQKVLEKVTILWKTQYFVCQSLLMRLTYKMYAYLQYCRVVDEKILVMDFCFHMEKKRNHKSLLHLFRVFTL